MDIQQLKMVIAQKLRTAREEKDLSQEDIAKQLGVTAGAYGSFERATNLIALNYLIDLSRILQKPITYFLPVHVIADSEHNDPMLDPRFSYLVEMWQVLPEYARDHLRRQVKLMEKLNPDLRAAMAERGWELPDAGEK